MLTRNNLICSLIPKPCLAFHHLQSFTCGESLGLSDHALFHIAGQKAGGKALGTRLFDHWITYQIPLPVVRRINMDQQIWCSPRQEKSVCQHTWTIAFLMFYSGSTHALYMCYAYLVNCKHPCCLGNRQVYPCLMYAFGLINPLTTDDECTRHATLALYQHKGWIGGGSRHSYNMPCMWQLSWLAVERPCSALAGPFFSLLAQAGVETTPLSLQGLHFWHCRQFRSGGTLVDQKALTIISLSVSKGLY